jgi:hypothetical protein
MVESAVDDDVVVVIDDDEDDDDDDDKLLLKLKLAIELDTVLTGLAELELENECWGL